MDSLLEEQRSVIKFLVAGDEKPCHIFQRLKKRFSGFSGFLSFVKAEQVFVIGLELGDQLRR
jgi:hypothetical protein